MPGSGSSASTQTKDLLNLIKTSEAVIAQYKSALTKPSTQSQTPATVSSAPNPLHVLRDAAKLLQAHVTKLSLLLLNKPFTASAIAGQIRAVTTTCLPAMMSAVELCDTKIWGRTLRGEVDKHVATILREMHLVLLRVVEIIDETSNKDEDISRKTSRASEHGRDTLLSTGLLWEGCDQLIELDKLGVGGLALRKAQQYHDQLKDAVEELKEWGQDDGEEDDDSDDDAEGDAVHEDDLDDEDDMFASADKIPKDRVELKRYLVKALDQMKKTDLLYTAIKKRRLQTFAKAHERLEQDKTMGCLDDTIDGLRQLSENIDDIANAFYETDEEDVKVQLEGCLDRAKEIIASLRLDWEGREDEFTRWSDKWKEIVVQR